VATWLVADCGGQSDWLAWDIVRNDGTRELGCLSASSWAVAARRGGFVWSRIELCNRVDAPIQPVVVESCSRAVVRSC
jgi:hypothetical protein